jgi:hypothetical protein
MIRVTGTSLAELKAAIRKVRQKPPSWFDAAKAALAALPAPPASSDFAALWGEVKEIYIERQQSKCCFCESPLEGNITQDVEHFRPKAKVEAWAPPPELAAAGVAPPRPAEAKSHAGYARLAYHPHNYAMACKVCNSTLKRNYFPVAGPRRLGGADPAKMGGEKAYLIYPLGDHDADPEALIEFDGLSARPKRPAGFDRQRALVTIALFRLNDAAGRFMLFKARALLLHHLFLALEAGRAAAVASLTSPANPFTNCMRSFARLHRADRPRAAKIAAKCEEWMRRKSVRRRT